MASSLTDHLDALRTLLAGLTVVQTHLDADDATEALPHIHLFSTWDDPPYPALVVDTGTYARSTAGYAAPLGINNQFRLSITAPHDPASPDTSLRAFYDLVANIADNALTAAAQASSAAPALQSWTFEDPPMLLNEQLGEQNDTAPTPYWWSVIIFTQTLES